MRDTENRGYLFANENEEPVMFANCCALVCVVLAFAMSAAPAFSQAQREPGPSHPYYAHPDVHTSAPPGPGSARQKRVPPSPVQEMVDPHLVPPHVGPGPMTTPRGAASQRSIIFVGGRTLTNDKAALNPQPIPPGRIMHPLPHSIAPLSNGAAQ
jgi:hypothetical protein